jgi:hypothetical protein
MTKHVGREESEVKDRLRYAVLRAFDRLVTVDGCLFDCPIETNPPGYDARKLHEVCVNHRLANYLEAELLPMFPREGNRMFVDIEFNREGCDFKNLRISGQEKRVRPDIIVHNRKTGADKVNFLIAECKKNDSPNGDIAEDCDKIRAFIEDQRYAYFFGLQVIYEKGQIRGILFFKRDGRIESEPINYSQQVVGP